MNLTSFPLTLSHLTRLFMASIANDYLYTIYAVDIECRL